MSVCPRSRQHISCLLKRFVHRYQTTGEDHTAFSRFEPILHLTIPTSITRRRDRRGTKPNGISVLQSGLASRAKVLYDSQPCVRSGPSERPRRRTKFFKELVIPFRLAGGLRTLSTMCQTMTEPGTGITSDKFWHLRWHPEPWASAAQCHDPANPGQRNTAS